MFDILMICILLTTVNREMFAVCRLDLIKTKSIYVGLFLHQEVCLLSEKISNWRAITMSGGRNTLVRHH